MTTHRIAVIGGDGIGPEVTAEALKVVRAAGVSLQTTDFDLSDRKKQVLVDSGRDCTNAYFEWFNSRDAEPVNRMVHAASAGV